MGARRRPVGRRAALARRLLTRVVAGVAARAGLQLLLVIASCLLCCYNKAQTLEEKYDGKGTFVEFY